MQVRLDQITVRHFKRIEELTINLKPVTALIGRNTSGKSSALQAAQLGVSILQATLRRLHGDGTPDFAATVSNDAVLFRPTERLLDLRRGDPATQNLGFSITYSHGSMLMDGLRTRIHQQVGGATQDCENIIYSSSDHLIAPNWTSVFNPPQSDGSGKFSTLNAGLKSILPTLRSSRPIALFVSRCR